ncbi:MAG TPA: MauE/DoxX family redox-associated membrane protein [Bacilli bacterium]|nr:MauE/DoxX family redox-associated membrane protein [Bacilli bacterium]
MEELALFARLTLALLFLTAAWSKLSHYEEHLAVLANYNLLPRALVKPFSLLEALAEIVVGLLLLLGLFAFWGELGAMLLLVMYTLAVGINLLRGRSEINCGCGGAVGSHKLSWWLVLRNVGLLAVSSWLLQSPALIGSVQGLVNGMSFAETFGGATSVVLLLTVFELLLLYSANQIGALRTRISELLSE